ncbi:MAG: hypothetical protein K8S25_04150 [Alphaproteobacteria bacterium]|nr:hypothetical protein [Alphaproteobacteria bacterium]
MATKDFIGYQARVDRALRGVVREALIHAATGGMMGAHHFYIAFDTNAPGVQISDTLHNAHPHELTIVLQNQYWGLKVGENEFEVGLSFNKMPETIVIPFSAILQFSDPNQGFGFKFQPTGPSAVKSGAPAPKAETPPPAAKAEEPAPKPEPRDEAGTIVSLDKFRKK